MNINDMIEFNKFELCSNSSFPDCSNLQKSKFIEDLITKMNKPDKEFLLY